MIESEGVGGLGLGLVETELCMWFYVKLRKAKKIMALEMMGGKGNGMKGKKKPGAVRSNATKAALYLFIYIYLKSKRFPPTPRLLRREDQGSKKKKRKNRPPLEFV